MLGPVLRYESESRADTTTDDCDCWDLYREKADRHNGKP